MHSIIYEYAPASFHRTWTTNTELGPTVLMTLETMMNLSSLTLELNFFINRHYIHYLHCGLNSMSLNFNITEQHLKSILEINYLQSHKPKFNSSLKSVLYYIRCVVYTLLNYHLSIIYN
jgi:hypothetical protein